MHSGQRTNHLRISITVPSKIRKKMVGVAINWSRVCSDAIQNKLVDLQLLEPTEKVKSLSEKILEAVEKVLASDKRKK